MSRPYHIFEIGYHRFNVSAGGRSSLPLKQYQETHEESVSDATILQYYTKRCKMNMTQRPCYTKQYQGRHEESKSNIVQTRYPVKQYQAMQALSRLNLTTLQVIPRATGNFNAE